MDITNVAETASTAVSGKVPVLSTFLIGLGTVFVALIALVYLIKLMGGICSKIVKKKPETQAPVKKAIPNVPAPQNTENIQNREEIIAASSAAIATVMGKDVDAIRIVSVKKIG